MSRRSLEYLLGRDEKGFAKCSTVAAPFVDQYSSFVGVGSVVYRTVDQGMSY